jgi:molecular chaperone DnaK
MALETPIGIDLGTTNSAMARIDYRVDIHGQSAMIVNAEGEIITPSIVFFSDSEVVVGKNARTAVTSHPDMVAQWVKRDMGSPFYSHPIRGQYLPPEVIQACILRKLNADIVRAAGSDIRTVITVPAYFDEMRRKATADAGDMAGLRVLDIVNEPTAAALAFGEALGYLSPQGAPRDEINVLVYDLGGGTFDVTLLHLAPGKIQTLATDGDMLLGGHDWDQRIVDLAAEHFIKLYQGDPRQDPASLNRLYQDAMEAKHTLTARSRTSLNINFAGHSAELALTREQFEELTADLLERTSYTCRQLLGTAGLSWDQVDRVLLVGGSTRMPMVGKMLLELTGRTADRTVNPDEAVARGAAIYAGYLLARQSSVEKTPFQVTNVNAHSLGVEGIDADTLRKKNVVLIPRNSPLPARHSEKFSTKSAGQRSIVIKVLEGESPSPGECIAIGRTVVRELPAGLPQGWPVEITFEYAINGRLAVHASVPGTKQLARLELVREAGLSGSGLNRWKVAVESGGDFRSFESAAQDVLAGTTATPTSPSSLGSSSSAGWALAAAAEPPAASQTASSQKWASVPQPLNFSPQQIMDVQAAEMRDAKPQAAEAEPVDVAKVLPKRPRRKTSFAMFMLGNLIAAGLALLVVYFMFRHMRPDLLPH